MAHRGLGKVFLISLFFFAMAAVAGTEATLESPAHNIVNCRIFDRAGHTLRQLPGVYCAFLPDGSFVSANSHDLTFYNSRSEVVWRRKIPTHHQVNLSLDGQKILVMTSSFKPYEGKKVRFDKVAVYDFNGNELKAFDFFDHIEGFIKIAPRKHYLGLISTLYKFWPDVEYEFSHATSFYEIGENKMGDVNPAFKKGNYVINVNLLMLTVIIDSNLKKILWSIPYACADGALPLKGLDVWQGRCRRHDVQILPNGNLLSYVNQSMLPINGYSSIVEVDPRTRQEKVVYMGDPLSSFASPICGGVQVLPNGNLLISDITNGGAAFEVNAQGKRIWSWTNDVLDKKGRPAEIQQIKRADLSDFLRRNQSL